MCEGLWRQDAAGVFPERHRCGDGGGPNAFTMSFVADERVNIARASLCVLVLVGSTSVHCEIQSRDGAGLQDSLEFEMRLGPQRCFPR